MTPQAQAVLKLDLRHVAFFQNAAEPVRASTVSWWQYQKERSRILDRVRP